MGQYRNAVANLIQTFACTSIFEKIFHILPFLFLIKISAPNYTLAFFNWSYIYY